MSKKALYRLKIVFGNRETVNVEPTYYRLENGWLTVVWDRDQTAEYRHYPATAITELLVDVDYVDPD